MSNQTVATQHSPILCTGDAPTKSVSKFEEFKSIVKQYEDYRKSLTTEFIQEVVKELGEKYGTFAVFMRGYTPSFNDGEPCEHSSYYSLCVGSKESTWQKGRFYFLSDDCEAEEHEEVAELLECNFETMTSINSHLEGNEEFITDIDVLQKIVDEALYTNWEVKIKYQEGVVTFEQDDYDCDY